MDDRELFLMLLVGGRVESFTPDEGAPKAEEAEE